MAKQKVKEEFETNGLPEKVARKYEPLVTPTVIIIQNPYRRIDMRTMTLKDADTLYQHNPTKYLKLRRAAPENA